MGTMERKSPVSPGFASAQYARERESRFGVGSHHWVADENRLRIWGDSSPARRGRNGATRPPRHATVATRPSSGTSPRAPKHQHLLGVHAVSPLMSYSCALPDSLISTL